MAFLASAIANGIKDGVYQAGSAIKSKTISLYNLTVDKVDRYYQDNQQNIIFAFSTATIALFNPGSALINGLVGYIIKDVITSDETKQSQGKPITAPIVMLVTIGAIGAALPVCSLTVLMIIAGSFGIGAAANNARYYFWPIRQ